MAGIQIASDLHLESPPAYDLFTITPKAPYLALLGDIGNVVKHGDQLFAFLIRHLRAFRAVLFVPGNHEAYHSTWPETLTLLKHFESEIASRRRSNKNGSSELGELVVMDRASFTIPAPVPDAGSVLLLGCSLFSRVPAERAAAVGMGLNDFYATGDEWDVDAHNAAHKRDVAWLNERVALAQQDSNVAAVVIVTHWSPSTDRRAIEPRHAGSAVSSGFSTDLSGQTCWMGSKVRVWACGHTHFNFDFCAERGGGKAPLRVVTNQRGYYFQQAERFDAGKVIEI